MLNWLRIGHVVDGGSSLCDEINPGFALESLEARILLAAQVPTDYVKINSAAIAVQSQSPTPTQTDITLQTGQNYYLVASGTHDLTRDGRLADAQFYQRSPDLQWVTGSKPHLRVTGVSSWGAYQSDHEYGVHLVGNGAELAPWISDSYYSDNSGFLYLDVYQQVPEFVNSTDDDADLDLNDGTAWTGQFTPEGIPEVTLRSLIQHSNATEGRQIVGFNIPGGGVHVITPNGALPAITDATDVDGTTQPGYSNNSPVIQINGQGLVLEANDSSILGLSIIQAPASGVEVTGSQNTIRNNLLARNGTAGVAVFGAATGTTVEKNTIGNLGAGNQVGVHIRDGASSSVVHDNTIHHNTGHGIIVEGNGTDNTVVEGNTVSQNHAHGILIRAAAQDTLVIGNTVESNEDVGVMLEDVTLTQVGDGAASGGNTIRLNNIGVGVLRSPNTSILGNTIESNEQWGIGIQDIAGTQVGNATPDGLNTIRLNHIGVGVLRGPATVIHRNLIQSNNLGIGIEDSSTVEVGDGTPDGANTIRGNFTGIAVNANAGVSNNTLIRSNEVINNDGNGIVLRGEDASQTVIDTNGISGNGAAGILVQLGANNTSLIGNGIENNFDGIILDAAPDNRVGQIGMARNLIRNNDNDGVRIVGAAASANSVANNDITGNGASGVVIGNAPQNMIGGVAAGADNLIQGNALDGVQVTGPGATGNAVLGNDILNNRPFSGVLTNSDGIEIANDAANTSVFGNEIRDNGGNGVNLNGAGGGNVIGNDTGANAITGNGTNGVRVADTNGTTIADNAIVGNSFHGVEVRDTAAGNNVIDNFLNQNGMYGVRVSNANNNQINANQITGNGSGGIEIALGASGNSVKGNLIQANSGDGIEISEAGSNSVGIIAPFAGNTIIGNSGYGVQVFGNDADGNTLTFNTISGNGLDGVFIGFGADNNTLRSNTISANTLSGVRINAGDNNIIGVEGLGNVLADNLESGVTIFAGTGNRIRFNTFADNGLLPIDLGEDETVTANDPDDPDIGANNLQNFPQISSAILDGNGDLSVNYLVSTATINATYPLTVDFYRLRNGVLELIGTDHYDDTEAGSLVNVAFTPALSLAVGDDILAIATDDAGNTSEFSLSVTL